MEEIIKKSVEGGWKPREGSTMLRLEQSDYGDWGFDVSLDCIFLDPLFWQSLGKAMGWSERGSAWMKYEVDGATLDTNKNTWLIVALHFHKINLTEGFDKAVKYLQSITTK